MAYKSLKKRRQYLKDWKLKNTEKVKKSRKKYYLKNKKKILKKQREYFKANPLIKSETNKRYRKKYPEKIREQNKKKYYDSISTPLKKKLSLRNEEYMKQNKEKIIYNLNLDKIYQEELESNCRLILLKKQKKLRI